MMSFCDHMVRLASVVNEPKSAFRAGLGQNYPKQVEQCLA